MKKQKDHNSRRASATSSVSEQLKSRKHPFVIEKFRILAKELKDYSRKAIEAIYIRKNNPTLNRFGVQPRLGKSLLKN